MLFLAQNLHEARIAEETEFGFAQVVREPQVPRKPTQPRLPFALALGGFAGLVLGVGGAALRYRTDARVYTPTDLETLGFTVLGTLPTLASRTRAPRAGEDWPAVNGFTVSPALVTLVDPFSPKAESFRHLHAALQGGACPQIVLVASPEAGSGKSTVAANLAVAAAQAGRRTLLVDADLRRPSIHTYLGLGVLSEKGEGTGAQDMVYWGTAVPELFALTAKSPASTPDALWRPLQAARLLHSLRAAFDFIVVDAPPVLLAADASILAPHTDAGLLVAAAGRTDADAFAQVANELAGAGLGQIAAVLNRFEPAQGMGHRRTYGYRYATWYSAVTPVEPGQQPASPAMASFFRLVCNCNYFCQLSHMHLLGHLLALSVLLAPLTAAQSQEADPCQGRLGRAELAEATSDTYYRFYLPGEATVQVHVAGTVEQPGLYEVSVGTDLGRLLALAGGPRYGVREERQTPAHRSALVPAASGLRTNLRDDAGGYRHEPRHVPGALRRRYVAH